VRVRAGEKILEAIYGQARPDVAKAHPDNPHALASGFVADYALPPNSSQPVIFEAQTADGRWRCFAAQVARVSAEIPEHLRRDYASWVRQFDTLDSNRIVALRARLDALDVRKRPLISILLPAYNTPESWLVRAIESVRAQIYPHWELCVADDASTAPHVRRILDNFSRRDARIKIRYRSENGHISAASNSALALATGEFAALLDHDDELAPHALAEVIFALADRPDLEFLYSDEDKIDEQGRRFDPYFKPDWNPDLLLGQNYTCHLSVFRTSRLRAVGGFRTGFEGSQDWDLTLRATDGLDGSRIHHIPRVLYHWRAISGSTALVIDQKNNYPFIAAEKALTEHLGRAGVPAELVSVAGHHWRVKRHLPAPPPKVSIIIPTKNGESLLRVCIGSILAKTTYPNFEIVLVNNRSDDPAMPRYFEELRGRGIQVLDYDAPFNFSAINNFAVRSATGSVLVFLNNDMEVISADWLEELVSQALRPEIGCVGAMLYYPNDTVQHAGAVLGLTGPAGKDGVAGHAFKGAKRGSEGQRNRLRLVQNYSAVTAACLAVRREIFDEVGGFNERELAVAFNDIDFCLRVLKAGYRNLWTPFAELYHHESASRGPEDSPEKIARFQGEIAYMRRTWAAILDHDPAYNPNLSLQHEDFSLAFPPR
jgi:GT2 family glycosyltransferase